nr:hypothetical protein [Tanacetum cinerariifolium]
DFHESSSSESSDGTSGTPGLEPRSLGSTGVVALKGCFPLAVSDSRGADSAVVVGVRVGGVVEEAESPFFFLELAFGLGAASPITQTWYS